MRDFWDFNNDGELDIWEESMKCATILSILDDTEEKDDGYGEVNYSNSGSTSGGLNAFGTFLLILGVLLLFGACAG